MLSKGGLATATAEYSMSQQQKSTLSPWYGTIPWGYQQATWRQIHYNEPLPLRKRQHFVLTKIDTLDVDLTSLYVMFLPKLPSMDLKNALSTVMVFHTAVLLRTHFTANEMQQWAYPHGIH